MHLRRVLPPVHGQQADYHRESTSPGKTVWASPLKVWLLESVVFPALRWTCKFIQRGLASRTAYIRKLKQVSHEKQAVLKKFQGLRLAAGDEGLFSSIPM